MNDVSDRIPETSKSVKSRDAEAENRVGRPTAVKRLMFYKRCIDLKYDKIGIYSIHNWTYISGQLD